MAITITKRPEYVISSGVSSRWTSAVHPIIYEGHGLAVDIVLRPNYYINFFVYEAGSNLLLAKFSHRPKVSGQFVVNVAGFLRPYFSFDDVATQADGLINERDPGKSIEFYIGFQEVNDIDGEGEIITEAGKTFFAVNAALQPPRPVFGQNMVDMVPLPVANQVAGEAEFLTPMDIPVLFEGYPFSLSFPYDPILAGVELIKYEERRDLNGNYINEVEYACSTSGLGTINRLYISNSYPANTKYIDVFLSSGQLLQGVPGYVAKGYVKEGYVEQIPY